MMNPPLDGSGRKKELSHTTSTEKTMRRIAFILKIISRILAAPYIILAVIIGIVGIGPEGALSLGNRIGALFGFVIGTVYWLPNHRIKPYATIYFIVTLLPVAHGLGMCIYEIIHSGWDSSFVEEALPTLLLMMPLFLAPPASLFFYLKAEKQEEAEE